MNVKDVVAQRFQKLCEERNIKLNELANMSGGYPFYRVQYDGYEQA